jgi:LysM repeat protein
MLTKRIVVISLFAVLAIGLAACQLPASTPRPAAGPTATGAFPMPQETGVLSELEIAGTQTAMAQQSGGQQPVVTPAPAQPTSAPAEQPQATEPSKEEKPAESGSGGQAVSAPTSTPGIPKSYTLQKGEFPFCIARRFDVDPGELLALNGLGINSQTYPGQVLKIPQGGSDFPDGRALVKHPDDYTVQAGDTFYTIACVYGDVDPVYLAAYNGMDVDDRLKSGDVIQVP